MDASEETLDDSERDEPSDIDPADGLGVIDCPLVNGNSGSKRRVEFEEDGPRRALVVCEGSATEACYQARLTRSRHV